MLGDMKTRLWAQFYRRETVEKSWEQDKKMQDQIIQQQKATEQLQEQFQDMQKHEREISMRTSRSEKRTKEFNTKMEKMQEQVHKLTKQHNVLQIHSLSNVRCFTYKNILNMNMINLFNFQVVVIKVSYNVKMKN